MDGGPAGSSRGGGGGSRDRRESGRDSSRHGSSSHHHHHRHHHGESSRRRRRSSSEASMGLPDDSEPMDYRNYVPSDDERSSAGAASRTSTSPQGSATEYQIQNPTVGNSEHDQWVPRSPDLEAAGRASAESSLRNSTAPSSVDRRSPRSDVSSEIRYSEAMEESDRDQSPLKGKQIGGWYLQYSSNKRQYYYNPATEVSQWEKPTEWVEAEKAEAEAAERKAREQGLPTAEEVAAAAAATARAEEEAAAAAAAEAAAAAALLEPETEEQAAARREAEERKRLEDLKKEDNRLADSDPRFEYRRYLDHDLAEKMHKQVFGEKRLQPPYDPNNLPPHLERRLDNYTFNSDFKDKLLLASKYRREASAHLYNANYHARKAAGLEELRVEQEAQRLNFHNSIGDTIGTLMAQAKNEEGFNPESMKTAYLEWPTDRILNCHREVFANRRARYAAIRKYNEDRLAEVLAKYAEPSLKMAEKKKPDDPHKPSSLELALGINTASPDGRPQAEPSPVASSSSQSMIRGTEAYRTTQDGGSSRPILAPPPALPILDLEAIEAAQKRKSSSSRRSRSSSGSPPRKAAGAAASSSSSSSPSGTPPPRVEPLSEKRFGAPPVVPYSPLPGSIIPAFDPTRPPPPFMMRHGSGAGSTPGTPVPFAAGAMPHYGVPPPPPPAAAAHMGIPHSSALMTSSSSTSSPAVTPTLSRQSSSSSRDRQFLPPPPPAPILTNIFKDDDDDDDD